MSHLQSEAKIQSKDSGKQASPALVFGTLYIICEKKTMSHCRFNYPQTSVLFQGQKEIYFPCRRKMHPTAPSHLLITKKQGLLIPSSSFNRARFCFL